VEAGAGSADRLIAAKKFAGAEKPLTGLIAMRPATGAVEAVVVRLGAQKRAGASGKILQNPSKSFKILQNPSKSLGEVELLREHSILLFLLLHP
jgi:hypothetical protein